MPAPRIVGGSPSQAGWVHLRGNVVMEHGCQVATVLTLLQCCYHFMPSTVPREELLGSDEQQGVARGFLSECPFKCILWIIAHSPKRVGKLLSLLVSKPNVKNVIKMVFYFNTV